MSNICPPVVVDMETYIPTKFGLFSVAKPFPDLDEHWRTCGVQYESYACPLADTFIHECTSPGTKAIGQTPTTRTAAPMTIYASWDCAAGGKTPEEHRTAALDALDCALEREVEASFYLGTGEDTPQLINAGCTALNTAAAPVSIAQGIGMLEAAMGTAQCGEPTIWLPRELGSVAARYHQTYGSGNMLRSPLGSPMAFGTGFGNLSPVGVAPPAGVAWIYVTGPLYMARGGAFMTPPDFESAFDRTNNRLTWMAEETVLLSIDGCACFAVAVSTAEATGGGGGGGTGRPACDSVTVDPHIQRQTGAGNVVVAAGARSVTLTVIAGDTSVQINGDAAVLIPAGMSLSWGVDDCSQTLADNFTFTNDAGGDDFVVNWTV